MPRSKSPLFLQFGPKMLAAAGKSTEAVPTQTCTPHALLQLLWFSSPLHDALSRVAWMLLADGDRSQEGSSCKQRSAGLVITTTPSSPPAQLRDNVFLLTRSAFICSPSQASVEFFLPFLLQLNANGPGATPAPSSQPWADTQGTNATTSRSAPGKMGVCSREGFCEGNLSEEKVCHKR